MAMLPLDQECLYTLLFVPRERTDELLEVLLAPLVERIGGDPDLDSFFFVRFSEPRWQLRLRILGRPDWIQSVVRPMVEDRIGELERSGLVEAHEFHQYDREYERYGGEVGMRLAERLFHLDSVACLDLVRIDRAGGLSKSRRELAMALVDRFLDLWPLSADQRLEFYRLGYAWAVEQKTWSAEEIALLEARFQKIHDGLDRLFFGSGSRDPDLFFGGPDAARVATGFLERARSVAEEIVREHEAGRIAQGLVHLVWSYTHMMTNRLGVEATPEAILRFFMCRLLEERVRSTA